MKKISLILSLLLTGIVFSFSFASGESSGNLSLEVSTFILNIITDLFPNNHIVLAELHIVIRKSAHIFEYFVLGVSWFLTGKLWNMSYIRILAIGLLIAVADETIQVYSIDRGPSVMDAIIYDFLPFTLSSLVLFLINNKKGKAKMSTNTLLKLQQNQISTKQAYKELYKKSRSLVPFTKRAQFVKLKVIVPGERKTNRFLRILFFIPIPICLVRFVMLFIKEDAFNEKDMPLTKKEIMDLISSKGININIKSDSGERVLIKTI